MSAMPAHLVPPPDYGPLIDAEEVSLILRGKRPAQWVTRYVKGPGSGRVKLGKSTIFWYEHLVRAWIASHLEPMDG